jgi:hypothetical protein
MNHRLNDPTLKRLVAEHGLTIDGGLVHSGPDHRFVLTMHHPSVKPPSLLPNLVGQTNKGACMYFLVPSSCRHLSDEDSIDLHWFRPDTISIPASEWWPDDQDIQAAISDHKDSVFAAMGRETLERLNSREVGLFASALPVDHVPEMLIEDLLPSRGISVVYGDFDEFKTTTVLDMMAHVALGVPWQGRKVQPRPVIWYALEGKDELPLRLRALESRLQERDPAWGSDRMPLTVLDRIPDSYRAWRAELSRLCDQWSDYWHARCSIGNLPKVEKHDPTDGSSYWIERYPMVGFADGVAPVVVIDTLSLGLRGEDEKGPKAVEFIHDCLDLQKRRNDLMAPDEPDALAKWREAHPDEFEFMEFPVASHVIVIHHQTKTGTDFAGHRAIGADSNALYRVHRFGGMSDRSRPMAGQITPMRVKGMPRPAAIRFDVEIVPVEGTKQTAAILKAKATDIPRHLKSVVEALRALDDGDEIDRVSLNTCLDSISKAKNSGAKRVERKRNRDQLENAGILEPMPDEGGKLVTWLFHDPDEA